MDGIEWRRDKWGKLAKTWFWINERLGILLGNSLVADHPEIEKHLASKGNKNITMIPYGAKEVNENTVDSAVLKKHGLDNDPYLIVVARAEPENSVLEIVEAFSRKRRDCLLVVLGKYTDSAYHTKVKEMASEEVVFLGTIYDQGELSTLRYFAKLYIHGHTVGGTNPSLVEALGAGNALLCHDNKYNRWVAGDASLYFSDTDQASERFDELLSDNEKLKDLSSKATERFKVRFTWQNILEQYEKLFHIENDLMNK